jgi:hypothetical protein
MLLSNMRVSSFLILVGLPSLAIAQAYVLQDDYEPTSFFDMFDFFTVSDTSHHPVLSAEASTAISVYFFPRNATPANITSGNPDPSGGPKDCMLAFVYSEHVDYLLIIYHLGLRYDILW